MKSMLYGIMAGLLAGSIATAMAMRSYTRNAGCGAKALDNGSETALALLKLDSLANSQYVFQRSRLGLVREQMSLAGAGRRRSENQQDIPCRCTARSFTRRAADRRPLIARRLSRLPELPQRVRPDIFFPSGEIEIYDGATEVMRFDETVKRNKQGLRLHTHE